MGKTNMLGIVRDALIVLVLSAAVALAFNALRPEGIDLLAKQDYAIFVPCPEPMGEAEPMEPSQIRWNSTQDLIVDSRAPSEYARWHAQGSRNVAYDYLEPVSDRTLKELAATGAKRVIVIGDGGQPDTGELLARELAGRGLKNVYYLAGGVRAIGNRQSEKDDEPS